MEIISRSDLAALIDSGEDFVLGEVLSRAHWDAGHLPRAAHFPLDGVAEAAAEHAPDKSRLVVLYCASDTCQNSHIAAHKLESFGYRAVRVYAGGKADWKNAGLPVVTS